MFSGKMGAPQRSSCSFSGSCSRVSPSFFATLRYSTESGRAGEIMFRILFGYILQTSINIILSFYLCYLNIFHLRLNVQKHAAANPGKDSCVAASQRKEDLRLTKVNPFYSNTYFERVLRFKDDLCRYTHMFQSKVLKKLRFKDDLFSR